MVDILGELGGVGVIAPTTALTLILLWVVRLVMTGKLIPDETHQRIVATKDAQLQASEAAREKLNSQVERLTQLAETTKYLLESLGGVSDDRE